jgi:hypothetical protein
MLGLGSDGENREMAALGATGLSSAPPDRPTAYSPPPPSHHPKYTRQAPKGYDIFNSKRAEDGCIKVVLKTAAAAPGGGGAGGGGPSKESADTSGGAAFT